MKVVVIGGTGFIGSKVVAKLTEHAHEFYEFVGRIADSATDGDTVRVSSAPGQPMAADDVATAVARTAAATVFPTRFTDWLVDNAPVPVR